MHVPDGLVAPQVYVPLWIVSVGLMVYSFKRIRGRLNEKTISYVALLSAFSFVLSSVAFPLPGGTSVHGIGVAPLSLTFGPWVAFLCYALVLLLQFASLGHGGITTYPVNLLSMGFVVAFSSYGLYNLLPKWRYSAFLAGFTSTLLSAAFFAILLGIHPLLFVDSQGKPLYFPYPFKILLPAILIPHMIIALIEGFFTQSILSFLKDKLLKDG